MSRSALIIAGLAILVFVVTMIVSMDTVRAPRPDDDASTDVEGADPARGARLVDAYGCGSCHVVPGVPRAEGRVGPRLAGIAEQHYIAGALVTSPATLARWIRDPQGVEPGTAMPDLGVSAGEARDIAAYLYTLE